MDAGAQMKVFPGTHDKLESYAARCVCIIRGNYAKYFFGLLVDHECFNQRITHKNNSFNYFLGFFFQTCMFIKLFINRISITRTKVKYNYP